MDGKVPSDAHVCLIRPPRAPNVDIGYTAKALEIELRLGIKNPQQVFADKGEDWRQQTRQMAEYIVLCPATRKGIWLAARTNYQPDHAATNPRPDFTAR